MWLSVGGTLHLSVSEELLEANADPLVQHHDSVRHLGDFASNIQFADADTTAADDQRRARRELLGGSEDEQRRQLATPTPTRTCSAADSRTRITLLYEARSGHSILIPEALEAVHSIESSLKEWLHGEGLCWADSNCECLPFDSIASYLFPQILDPKSAAPMLLANGAAPVRPVCAPSYAVSDLADALGWLADHGKSAFARRAPSQTAKAGGGGGAAGGGAAGGGAAGGGAAGGISTAAAAAAQAEDATSDGGADAAAAESISEEAGVLPSRYLRTFAYLSKPRWSAAKQQDPDVTRRLRAALDRAASSLRVR